MIELSGIYFGTIVEVLPPGDPKNRGEYQYEYMVEVAMPLYANLPTRCIRMDPCGGGLYNYDDIILGTGYMVFVAFPMQDHSVGLILGGARKHSDKQRVDGALRAERRFNEILQGVSQDGTWSVKHESTVIPVGPSLTVGNGLIEMKDGGVTGTGLLEQSISIDRLTNTISINAGTWNVDAKAAATINVIGNCNISCLNATVDAKLNANINATNVNVKAKLNAKVEANLIASIKGQFVHLNASVPGIIGQVITTATQPTCYITGIPFQGSKSVFAGD